MASPQEISAMRHAIALSALGLGTTSPNPPVGCLILDRDGHTVGTGYHRRKGEPHAEVHALAAAGPAAAGGTAVVTLEPCNHVGVTPACRQALIDAGIHRVVISVLDPTSRGAGGAAVLAEAGIEVETGLLTDEALSVLGPWLTATRTARPHLTWIFAASPGPNDDYLQRVNELRRGTDLVVFPDRLEEGIAGGHSTAYFREPSRGLVTGDVTDLLADSFASGARSLLLVGASVMARAALARDLLDRLVIVVPRVTADGTSAVTNVVPAFTHPISSVATTDNAIILTAQRLC